MTQKLQQLQQAIREVCFSDKMRCEYCEAHDLEPAVCCTRYKSEANIHFENILQSIDDTKCLIDSSGSFHWTDDYDAYSITYNLTLPLDQQSPEVIDFLHSIICKG